MRDEYHPLISLVVKFLKTAMMIYFGSFNTSGPKLLLRGTERSSRAHALFFFCFFAKLNILKANKLLTLFWYWVRIIEAPSLSSHTVFTHLLFPLVERCIIHALSSTAIWILLMCSDQLPVDAHCLALLLEYLGRYEFLDQNIFSCIMYAVAYF